MILILATSLVAPSAFVEVKAGSYLVGKDTAIANPLRTVILQGFQIAKFETTNAEFAKFVDATGYITDAERNKNAMVFEPGLRDFRWLQDPTANWRFPNGKTRGGIKDRMDHPVTTISYRDAVAYCKWAGVRLPNLDEWEVASRAGAKGDWFFGEQKKVGEYANIWHGPNHLKADHSDGYMTTSPVGKFKPNAWGLYDIYGNVFEMCSGNLKGDGKFTIHSRGGSWWCSKNSCSFFNSVDIGKVDSRASFSNQGFRVAR